MTTPKAYCGNCGAEIPLFDEKLFKEMSHYKQKCVDLMCEIDKLKKENKDLEKEITNLRWEIHDLE